MKRILNYIDDLLIITGIGCLVRAGFLLGEMWGYAVAGLSLIGYGIIIARGGAAEC